MKIIKNRCLKKRKDAVVVVVNNVELYNLDNFHTYPKSMINSELNKLLLKYYATIEATQMFLNKY